MFSLPTVGDVLSFGFAPFLSFNAIEVVVGGLVALEVSTDLLVAGIRNRGPPNGKKMQLTDATHD